MNDGPFTDEMIRHWVLVCQTQEGIIKYAEAMAQVLAEAGMASHKAVGDTPEYAVDRWSEVIRKRARQILRGKRERRTVFPGAPRPQLPHPSAGKGDHN